MKRTFFNIILVCCFAATISITASADVQQVKPLSHEAKISLLTCSPSDVAIYALYGHTAIRVYDPDKNFDKVFNFGMFDSTKPNFLYHFAKGEMDYMLSMYDVIYFMIEYIDRGSEVYEQVLNLLPEEKEALWQALMKNERPENRVYRYNYFFDNCATRPIAIIEKNIKGTIKYAPQNEFPTFRDVINHCTRDYPWIIFGCDLIMGIPTDRVITQKETFFIPLYLLRAVDMAEIVREDTTEPLVMDVNILNVESQKPEKTSSFLTSPLACFTLLLIIFIAITLCEWRRKKYFRLADCTLFFAAGAAGCLMYFLSFLSIHPGMFPNISLLWLHPFHFLGVIFFSVKKLNKMAYWYHFINFAAISVMSVAWIFIPQHFNIAFFPLIATLLLRSGWALVRKKMRE